MGTSCPFCNQSIDEDLLRFGGTCPMCFGEIPGEEAPTDPGEAVIAAQDKRDERARLVRLIPFAMGTALAFMMLIGGAVFVVYQSGSESLELVDFDTIEFDWEGEDDIEFAKLDSGDAEGSESNAKVATSTPTAPQKVTRPKTELRNAKIGDVGGIADADLDIATREDVQSAPRGTKSGTGTQDATIKDPTTLARSSSGGLDLGGVGSVGIKRNAIPNFVLEDDDAIINMAARVMKNEGRALKACYQQGLKQDESLRGRWVVNFTIKTDGHPKSISVESTGASNAMMEQCMANKIEKWQFQKIYKELPVRKSFRFQPG